ncbi:tetratricopeptide repeat protein [Amycolatopsis sp. NPDC051102]|uniref:ATP-binding protein n=1 Tax=Amycolatopsis sp. NPDC051102 TaxID=3155163 RepID=UPI003417E526
MSADVKRPVRVVGTPVAYGLETFKDRTLQQEKVLRALTDGRTRLVTIVGRRGIGKSALAARIVARIEDDRAPWMIANISSRTSGLSLERIFLDCARLLGGEAEENLLSAWTGSRAVVDKVAELLDAFTGHRCLLVLDNLEDRLTDVGEPLDGDLRDFFEALFRTRHLVQVLVTTQVPIALPPAVRRYETRIYLDDGLPPGDGVALLRELDRDGEAGLERMSDAELATAVSRLHGVPRAIELAFGALVEDYLTLPTLQRLLDTYATRGDMVKNLAQEGVRRLDDETRLVLDVLAVFGRPTPVEAVASVLRPIAPDLDVAAALARLAARGRMVTVDRVNHCFRLHPLDADLVFSELSPDGLLGRRQLDRHVADWYASTKSARDGWRTADDVLPQRREFAHRVRAGDHEVAAQVLAEVDEFLIWRGAAGAVVAMHEQLLDRLTGDIKLGHLVGYGLSLMLSGSLEEASDILSAAVELSEQVDDIRLRQRATYALGDVYRQLGELDLAVAPLTRSERLAEEIGEFELLSRTLLSLSLTHSYRRNVSEAQRVAERMRVHADKADDDGGRAQAHDADALAAVVAQNWQRAIDASGLALDHYEKAGITEALGYAYNVMGIAHLALGQYGEAEENLLRGHECGLEQQIPRIAGMCLYNLGWLAWRRRDHAAAAAAASDAGQALGRAGARELAAMNRLADAARAMVAGDRAAAASGLLAAATSSRGNADLVPAEWLEAEAALIADNRQSGEKSGQGAEDDES